MISSQCLTSLKNANFPLKSHLNNCNNYQLRAKVTVPKAFHNLKTTVLLTRFEIICYIFEIFRQNVLTSQTGAVQHLHLQHSKDRPSNKCQHRNTPPWNKHTSQHNISSLLLERTWIYMRVWMGEGGGSLVGSRLKYSYFVDSQLKFLYLSVNLS